MRKAVAATPKCLFVIDWRIEGTAEIAASSAEEAQELFDAGWGSPRGTDPHRDGDVSNGTPRRKTAGD